MGALKISFLALAVCGMFFGVMVSVLAVTYALPSTGQLAYVTLPTRSRGGQVLLMDVDRQFRHHLFTLPLGVTGLVYAPDGERMALVLERFDDTTSIFVLDFATRRPVNVTGGAGFNGLPAWSPDGDRLAFVSTAANENPYPYLVNADGTGLRRLADVQISFRAPAWSPDGTRVALVAGGILVVDTATGGVLNRFDGLENYNHLTWSPAGQSLAYTALSGEALSLFVQPLDGSPPRRLTPSTLDVRNVTWSPDGRLLALMGVQNDNADIYVVGAHCGLLPDDQPEAACDHPLSRVTSSVGFDWQPSWSLDGAWISYISYQERLTRLVMVSADGAAARNIVTRTVGDFQPVWLP